MKADKYRFDGARTCDLRVLSCDGKEDATDKDEIPPKTGDLCPARQPPDCPGEGPVRFSLSLR